MSRALKLVRALTPGQGLWLMTHPENASSPTRRGEGGFLRVGMVLRIHPSATASQRPSCSSSVDLGYGPSVHWAEVEAKQPRLAALGHQRLADPGVVLVGTIRRDGTPRISPVEPFFWRGDLWLPMLLHSLKAKDLIRDPRVLVHNIVASRDGTVDGEFMLRGRAVCENDPRVHEEIAAAIAAELPWQPEAGKFDLFWVDVEHVASIWWGENNDQYLATWPPGHEQLRRGTSATSVGDPEPWSELLD